MPSQLHKLTEAALDPRTCKDMPIACREGTLPSLQAVGMRKFGLSLFNGRNKSLRLVLTVRVEKEPNFLTAGP